MSSASEAELVALYYGCKQATPICVTLEEMGHPQPAPTLITTTNITAQGLTTGAMMPKASKLNDQWFNWLKCHNAQRQFKYLWQKGILNRANYASKHHPATICPHSKTPTHKLIGYLRGCVKYPHIRTGHKAVSKYPKVVTYLYPSSQLTWLLQN